MANYSAGGFNESGPIIANAGNAFVQGLVGGRNANLQRQLGWYNAQSGRIQKQAMADYYGGRNQTAENVATTRADATKYSADDRAITGQLDAATRAQVQRDLAAGKSADVIFHGLDLSTQPIPVQQRAWDIISDPERARQAFSDTPTNPVTAGNYGAPGPYPVQLPRGGYGSGQPSPQPPTGQPSATGGTFPRTENLPLYASDQNGPQTQPLSQPTPSNASGQAPGLDGLGSGANGADAPTPSLVAQDIPAQGPPSLSPSARAVMKQNPGVPLSIPPQTWNSRNPALSFPTTRMLVPSGGYSDNVQATPAPQGGGGFAQSVGVRQSIFNPSTKDTIAKTAAPFKNNLAQARSDLDSSNTFLNYNYKPGLMTSQTNHNNEATNVVMPSQARLNDATSRFLGGPKSQLATADAAKAYADAATDPSKVYYNRMMGNLASSHSSFFDWLQSKGVRPDWEGLKTSAGIAMMLNSMQQGAPLKDVAGNITGYDRTQSTAVLNPKLYADTQALYNAAQKDEAAGPQPSQGGGNTGGSSGIDTYGAP